jgi:hypothetical protein
MRLRNVALLAVLTWVLGFATAAVWLEATGGWYEYHTVVRPGPEATVSYEEQLALYWAQGCRLAGRWEGGSVVGCPRYPVLGLNRWTP